MIRAISALFLYCGTWYVSTTVMVDLLKWEDLGYVMFYGVGTAYAAMFLSNWFYGPARKKAEPGEDYKDEHIKKLQQFLLESKEINAELIKQNRNLVKLLKKPGDTE